MHSMTESATSLREQKRWETSHRITLCAQRLTDERGLDGFTMDELAEAADVSRRTLFNYFPGKVDAVLGEIPEIPEEVVATFCAGGPHGHLVDDIAELVRTVLATKNHDRDEFVLGRRVLTGTPRLLTAAHERFEAITEEFAALVLEREGQAFGTDRARLLLRLLVALLDSALQSYVEGEDRPLDEVFVCYLRTARELLA